MKKSVAMLVCIISLCCAFFTACGGKEPKIIDITPSYSATEKVVADSTGESESAFDTESFQDGEESLADASSYTSSTESVESEESLTNASSYTSGTESSFSSAKQDDFDESLCLIIVVEENAESQSLLNYMIAKGYDFTADGTGFVTSINGRANKSPYYWMLYTDDKKNTTSSWGAVKYHGTVYYSASKGAKTLTVKPGYTYIWYYTKTNY